MSGDVNAAAETIRRYIGTPLYETARSSDGFVKASEARAALAALVAEVESANNLCDQLRDLNEQLRADRREAIDALRHYESVLAPLDAKIDFSLYTGTVGQMRNDLEYLRQLLADFLADVRVKLGEQP